jgi:hypothetical protein
MMHITTDEGFAFDYLAILEVKMFKMGGTDVYIERCKNSFQSQIGLIKFREVYHSPEYKELYDANIETFDAVEKARYGEISAKEVDNCNMRRYNAKVALREKFFRAHEQIEKKS